MNSSRHVSICLALAAFLVPASQAPALGGAAAKLAAGSVDEVIEVAARVSGRSVTPAARAALGNQLRQAAIRHGDDVLLAARRGGLELAEAAARHGDDVWRLGARVPSGARALALHADELLPLARRIGPEVLILESQHPAIAARVVTAFGDDAVRYLAVNAPMGDLPRLVGFAERADSAATRRLLFEAYRRHGGEGLRAIDWKVVMAVGLSTAAVTAAYQISDGIGDGLETVAAESPEQFAAAVGVFTQPVRITLAVLGVGLVAMVLWRLRPWIWRLTARLNTRPAGSGPTAHGVP